MYDGRVVSPKAPGTALLREPCKVKKRHLRWEMAFWDKDPGDDLLLHGLSHTTIGAGAFHFRVRDGIGWFHTADVTRERVEGRGGLAGSMG